MLFYCRKLSPFVESIGQREGVFLQMKRKLITAYVPVEVRFDVFKFDKLTEVTLWGKGLQGIHLKGLDEKETIDEAIKQFEEENRVKVEI